ncbi:MAG: histidinol phosphate phosphatase domain-containing protein [Planctomycetota bacterium]|jgi:histidinol phosphatase-like PHP family hydrolase|nr:histidinol phosphate phosphatase domain-containing protein [Planctomycetota bacterium]
MREMFDFHTHTLISDGDFIPAESARRAEVAGYRILGFSDHSDCATLESQMPLILAAARAENRSRSGLTALPGTELTHVRPGQIREAVRLARELGACYVLAHGETLSEPVAPGTNLAAIEAGVDILAHPGLISPDEARLAAERGVRLEISGKRGHSLANGHVAKLARKFGAGLIFGSDAHTVGDMPTRDFAERVCLAAGLEEPEVAEMFRQAGEFGLRLAKLAGQGGDPGTPGPRPGSR